MEYTTPEEGEAAIKGVDGYDLDGARLLVEATRNPHRTVGTVVGGHARNKERRLIVGE